MLKNKIDQSEGDTNVLLEWDTWEPEAQHLHNDISFSEVKSVFYRPETKTFYDFSASSANEIRLISLGKSIMNRLLLVQSLVIFRSKSLSVIKIINARLATKIESEAYYSKKDPSDLQKDYESILDNLSYGKQKKIVSKEDRIKSLLILMFSESFATLNRSMKLFVP